MKLNLRKVMALGVAALIGLGASAQTLTQEWAHTTGIPSTGNARFCTGLDGKVIVPDMSTRSIVAYDADGVKTIKELASFFESTEGLYSMSTVIEKVDTIAAEGQDTIFDTTWTEVKNVLNLTSAITKDDAGNILINAGAMGSASTATNWIIVPADGSDPVYVPVTLPDGVAAGRVDQVGRVVGDVLSETGGYLYMIPAGATAVAVIKIVNGEQDMDYSLASPTTTLAGSSSTVAVPALNSVDEIEAASDPSATFYLRARGTTTIYGWNEDGTEEVALAVTNASGGAESFDVFTLGDTQYLVQSCKSEVITNADGTSTGGVRSLSLAVYNVATGEVVASFDNQTAQGQWSSFTAEVIDDENVAIYQYCVSNQAALYTFTVAAEEPVAPLYMVGHNNVWDPANPTEIPATETAGVYSLSGVEFTNPEKAFKISENKGTWDEFNAKAMCADDDAVVQINTPTKLWLYAETNITYAENGTYDVTVDLSGEVKTITLQKSSGVEDIEAVETVAPVYYNLQGVEVANPANGLYIVKRGNKVAKEVVVK